MRYLIKFSYDGTLFHGFQRQKNVKNVQGLLEQTLSGYFGQDILIKGSGRTDAGVHAINQKIHFDLDTKITIEKLAKGLNSLLPEDIFVKKVEEVSDDFHARFSAIGKEYMYILNVGEYNPLERNYVYQHNKKLDVVEMERAMKYFEGTHNFKSFTKSDDEKDDYVRTISQTNLIRDPKDLNKITLIFVGTGFLRYMVRNMVGLLMAKEKVKKLLVSFIVKIEGLLEKRLILRDYI